MMNVREFIDGKEYTCTETKGEMIRCPVCNSPWMIDREGDVEHLVCDHLRFQYGEGGFYIANKWESETYVQRIYAVIEADDSDDFTLDGCAIFRQVDHPDVDEVVYHNWEDSPLVQWTIFWGFKR